MLPRCYDAVAQGHIASRWLRRSVAVCCLTMVLSGLGTYRLNDNCVARIICLVDNFVALLIA